LTELDAEIGGQVRGTPAWREAEDLLTSVPGVGPVTAQKILDYRQQHGAFGSVDELDAIAGIGPARLEQLRGLVAP
jgi:competence ComEA-like helix-hairpin-helix protein